MTDIRDLEGVLADHEALAPDPEGMIEAAHTGARRVRRRRRAFAGAGVAATIALGVMVPTVVSRLDDGQPTQESAARPTQTPISRPDPAAPNLHVEMAAGSGYLSSAYGVVGSAALAMVRTGGPSSPWSATVGVYPAGVLDEQALRSGESITIQGHQAYRVNDFRFPSTDPVPPSLKLSNPSTMPGFPSVPEGQPAERVIAWLDAFGAWVTVSGTDPDLQVMAEAVRILPGNGLRAPYRLGYLPAGLRLEHWTVGSTSIVGFSDDAGRPRRQAHELTNLPSELLSIRVDERSSYLDTHMTDLGAPTNLANHDSWYRTASGDGILVPEGGASLYANVGECNVRITVGDRTRFPYSEVKRIFESADFKDCKNQSTWTAPLP